MAGERVLAVLGVKLDPQGVVDGANRSDAAIDKVAKGAKRLEDQLGKTSKAAAAAGLSIDGTGKSASTASGSIDKFAGDEELAALHAQLLKENAAAVDSVFEELTGHARGAGDAVSEAGDAIDDTSKKADTGGVTLGRLATAVVAAELVIHTISGALRSFVGFLSDSIEASDRTSAALDRIDQAGDHVHRTVGDALAPGLERLADSLARLATNEGVVSLLDAIGTAAGTAASWIGSLSETYIRNAIEAGTWVKTLELVGKSLTGQTDLTIEQILKLRKAAVEELTKAAELPGPKVDLGEEARRAKGVADQINERQKREEEQARQRAAAQRAELADAVDRNDEYGASIRELGEEFSKLSRAIDSGVRPTQSYQRAVAELGRRLAELERQGLIEPPEIAFVPVIDRDRAKAEVEEAAMDLGESFAESFTEGAGAEYIDPVLDAQGKAIDQQVEFEKNIRTTVTAAIALGDAISSWNSEIGRAVSQMASLVGFVYDAQKAWRAGGSQRGYSAEGVGQGAAIGGAVGAAGQQYGAWKGDRGRSQFGGKRSGDYGDVGAQIGGIIGSYWGPVGALIGGVIGGALGGAIKKGADEGIAQIRDAAGQAELKITRDQGGLGRVAGDIGKQIVSAVEDISATLGGSLRGIADIGIKIRDDTISVVVDGVKRRFKEVDDAISFAVTEALKSSEISGLDQLIQDALRGTRAESLEELQSDLEAVQTVLGFGLGEIGMSARAASAEIDVLTSQMVRLLEGSDQLGRALGYLATEEARRWDALRDQITGDRDSPAEIAKKREQDRLIYNAERALRLAELAERREGLAARIALLEGEAAARKAEIGLGVETLRAKQAVYREEVNLLGGYANAAGQVVGVSIETLKAQLAAIDQLIAAFPAEIGKGDLKPIGGARGFGGGFGGITSRWEKLTDRWERAQKDLIDNLRDIALGESTTAYTGRERSEIAKNQLDALISRARGGDVAALEGVDDAFRTFAEIYKTFTGGGQGFLGDFRDVFIGYQRELTDLAHLKRPGRLRDGDVIFDRRFHETQREQLREAHAHRSENSSQLRRLIRVGEQAELTQREIRTELRNLRGNDYPLRRVGGGN